MPTKQNHNHEPLKPEITLLTGPMFAEKTSELLRKLKRYRFAQRKVTAIIPKSDTRSNGCVLSHDGLELDAVVVADESQILEICKDAEVVGIDEAQFLGPNLTEIVIELFKQGKVIYVSALDADFQGKPFENVAQLMIIPEVKVIKLHAVCVRCGDNATRSHRLVQNDQRILVGDTEYIPLCFSCFESALSKTDQ